MRLLPLLAAVLLTVVHPSSAQTPGAPVKLVILGDSTVADYPDTAIVRGWGQYLGEAFGPGVQVRNHAKSGRSSKSFLTEGLWEKAQAESPAYVLIQFGHNDSHARTEPKATDPEGDFRDYLRRYIRESRALGAQPVLITPMHRRRFENGRPTQELRPYAEAMKIVGRELEVPVIDLHTASGELFTRLGEAGSAPLSNAPGDRTHFSPRGARAMAELVLAELPRALPALKPHFQRQPPALASAPDLVPGAVKPWNGFPLHEIEFEKRKAHIVVPREPAPGRPWIWRARFWGHRPEVDIALLGHGYHLVYVDAPELIGSPAAVALWARFHAYLTEIHGLAPKAALEGMSRGGLYIFNFAAAHPDKVACVYADAPVCDFKSWPGGKGQGKGSPKDWQLVLQAYGFKDEAEALAWRGNPVDNLQPLAKAGIPLLHVVGDTDEVVPVAENTALVEARYRELGGSITVIHKPGVGHVHGLPDPRPVVDFIREHTRGR